MSITYRTYNSTYGHLVSNSLPGIKILSVNSVNEDCNQCYLSTLFRLGVHCHSMFLAGGSLLSTEKQAHLKVRSKVRSVVRSKEFFFSKKH